MAAHSGPNITGNTFTADTTAGGVQVVGPADYIRTVLIQNIDASVAMYIGGTSDSALTTANGIQLAAGRAVYLTLPPTAEVYAISGSSAEGRFLVLSGLQ